MAVSAGYAGDIYESASSTFTVPVLKVISVDITDAADMLDTSSIGAGQYKTSTQGMKQVNMSIEVNYDPSDTGQTALRAREPQGPALAERIRAQVSRQTATGDGPRMPVVRRTVEGKIGGHHRNAERHGDETDEADAVHFF
jgi:hypothetical protein